MNYALHQIAAFWRAHAATEQTGRANRGDRATETVARGRQLMRNTEALRGPILYCSVSSKPQSANEIILGPASFANVLRYLEVDRAEYAPKNRELLM